MNDGRAPVPATYGAPSFAGRRRSGRLNEALLDERRALLPSRHSFAESVILAAGHQVRREASFSHSTAHEATFSRAQYEALPSRGNSVSGEELASRWRETNGRPNASREGDASREGNAPRENHASREDHASREGHASRSRRLFCRDDGGSLPSGPATPEFEAGPSDNALPHIPAPRTPFVGVSAEGPRNRFGPALAPGAAAAAASSGSRHRRDEVWSPIPVPANRRDIERRARNSQLRRHWGSILFNQDLARQLSKLPPVRGPVIGKSHASVTGGGSLDAEMVPLVKRRRRYSSADLDKWAIDRGVAGVGATRRRRRPPSRKGDDLRRDESGGAPYFNHETSAEFSAGEGTAPEAGEGFFRSPFDEDEASDYSLYSSFGETRSSDFTTVIKSYEETGAGGAGRGRGSGGGGGGVPPGAAGAPQRRSSRSRRWPLRRLAHVRGFSDADDDGTTAGSTTTDHLLETSRSLRGFSGNSNCAPQASRDRRRGSRALRLRRNAGEVSKAGSGRPISTALVKHVPVVPGIPVAPAPGGFSRSAISWFVVLVALFFAQMVFVFKAFVIHDRVDIPPNSSVLLSVRNCNVFFSASRTNRTFVETRAWRDTPSLPGRSFFMPLLPGVWNHVFGENRGTTTRDSYGILWQPAANSGRGEDGRPPLLSSGLLQIRMHFSSYHTFFQCTAQIHVARSFTFHGLQIKLGNSAQLMSVEATIPLRVRESLEVEALHGLIHLNFLYAPKIGIIIGDGDVDFALASPGTSKADLAVLAEKHSWIHRSWSSLVRAFNGLLHFIGLPGAELTDDSFANENSFRPREISIMSQSAPVKVTTTLPLRLSITGDLASRSIFQAPGLTIAGGSADAPGGGMVDALIYSSDFDEDSAFDLAVALDMKSPAGFLTVLAETTEQQALRWGVSDRLTSGLPLANSTYVHKRLALPTWVGVRHLQSPAVVSDVKPITNFITGDKGSPWVVEMKVLGVGSLKHGTWRLLSSSAYYRANIWFTLLSGGMLSPRMKFTYVSVSGLFCRKKPPPSAVGSSQPDGGHMIENVSEAAAAVAAGISAGDFASDAPAAVDAAPPYGGDSTQTHSGTVDLTEARDVTGSRTASRRRLEAARAQAATSILPASSPKTFVTTRSAGAYFFTRVGISGGVTAAGSLSPDVTASWQMRLPGMALPDVDVRARATAGGPRAEEKASGPSTSSDAKNLRLPPPQKERNDSSAHAPRLRKSESATGDPLVAAVPEPFGLPSGLSSLAAEFYPLNVYWKEGSARGAPSRKLGVLRPAGGTLVGASETGAAQKRSLLPIETTSISDVAATGEIGDHGVAAEVNPDDGDAGDDADDDVDVSELYEGGGAGTGFFVANDTIAAAGAGGGHGELRNLSDAYPGIDVGALLPEELCQADILDDVFLAIYRTPIGPLLQSASSFCVEWAHLSAGKVKERVFSVRNGVVYSPTLRRMRDSAAFCCAVVINTIAAFVMAWKVFSYLVNVAMAFLLKELKDRQVLRATSHRLNHEVTEYEGFNWNVLLCRVYYPTHGFILRWNQRRSIGSPGRLAVQIKPVITQSTTRQLNLVRSTRFSRALFFCSSFFRRRMLRPAVTFLGRRISFLERAARIFTESEFMSSADDTDDEDNAGSGRNSGFSREVFLYIPYSDVETCRTGTRNQKELFIPMRFPVGAGVAVELNTSQRYHLDPKQNYRLRLLSLSTAGRVVDRSTWSQEIRPEGAPSFVDMALLVLQLVCPTRQPSLDQFLDKHTVEATGFRIPTRLYNLSLMLSYDVFSSPEQRRNGEITGDLSSTTKNAGALQLRRQRNSAGFSTRDATFGSFLARGHGSARKNNRGSTGFGRRRLTLSAFFGRSSQAAREDRARSGHSVFAAVHIDSRPRLKVINGPNGEERFLELRPSENAELFLERCRISQVAICFEVSETSTGQVLAIGSTRLEDMEIVVGLKRGPSVGVFHCFLFNTFGGGALWGRVLGSLDVSAFQPYIRHEPPLRDMLAASLLTSAGAGGRGRGFGTGVAAAAAAAAAAGGAGASASAALRATTRRRSRSNSHLLEVAAALDAYESNGRDTRGGGSTHVPMDDDLRFASSKFGGEGAGGAGGGGKNDELLTAASGTGERAPAALLSDVTETALVRYRAFGRGAAAPTGCRASAGRLEGDAGAPGAAGTGMTSSASFLNDELCGAVDEPVFVRDQPGRSVLQGSSMVIQWRWTAPDRPGSIYLHLLDHWTNQYLASVQWGHSIPNMGVHSWVADMDFGKDDSSRCVYFAVTLEPWEALPGHDDPLHAASLTPLNRVFVLAQSNAFFLVKALPLCELEMAYGSFCRTHNLEMQHLNDTALEAHDFLVHEAQLRVCQNLRRPLPFEDDGLKFVHCAGQCIVSSTSKMVMYRKKEAADSADAANGGGGGSAANVGGAGDRDDVVPVNSARRNSSEILDEGKSLEVYKSVSLRIKVVENCRIDQDRYNWLDHPSNYLTSMNLNYGTSLLKKVSYAVSILPGSALLLRRLPDLSHKRLRARLKQATQTAIPVAVGSLLFMYQILVTCSFPIFGMFLVAVHSYLLKAQEMETHRENSPEYISDLVFDFSPSFLIRMPRTFLMVATLCVVQTILIVAIVILGAEARRDQPQLFSQFDTLGRWLSLTSIFAFLWIFGMFLLWFILGALINSEAILPYAVMVGSAVALSYVVWNNFASARRWVRSYIEENLETLLSIALNNFFESVNLTFNEGSKELIVNDSRLIAFKDKIREEIKDKRNLARRAYQLERLEELERMSLTSNGGSTGDVTFSAWARKKREKICTLFFEKISPTPPNKFYFNDQGRPMGFEQERSRLSVGARLATASEVENNASRIEDFLKGSDVAMLKDGVKHGPRFGYLLTRGPQKGKDFPFAIIALPRYPRPEDIPVDLKLDMIFDNFNVVGDDYLDAKEFEAMVLTLNKKQFQSQSWEETCAVISYNFDVAVDPDLGIHRKDLGRIYDKIDDLDQDFQQLFPSAPDDYYDEELADIFTADTLSSSSSEEQAGSEEGGEALYADDDFEENDDSEDTGDERDAGGGGVHDGDNGSDTNNGDDDSDNEEYIRRTLMTNVNARKLQTVFRYFTQHYRARSTDEIISDVSFVSSKIVESHFTILTPIFEKEAVLGLGTAASSGAGPRHGPMGSPSAAAHGYGGGGSSGHPPAALLGSAVSQEDPPAPAAGGGAAPGASGDRLSIILKSLHVELERDLTKTFRAIFQQTYDLVAVRQAVVDFCDNVWPQKIQMRASRLTNPQLELSPSELHPESRRELCFPKTAHQVITLLRHHQITLTDEIRDVLALCNRGKRTDLDVPVGIVTRLLVAARVIGNSEVREHVVELGGCGGRMRRVVMSRPRLPECYHLLLRYVERHVGSPGAGGAKISVDQLIATIRVLLTEYLWFGAFKMLVRLLGVDLAEDEFPGSAVDVELDHASSELTSWLEEEYANSLAVYGEGLGDLHPGATLNTLGTAGWGGAAAARGSADGGDVAAAGFRGASGLLGPSDGNTPIFLGAADSSVLVNTSLFTAGNAPGASQPRRLTVEQKLRLKRNLLGMKRVFDQLSNGTCFLAVELADEAMLLLSDTRMHEASVIACLQHLGIGGTSMVGPTTATAAASGTGDRKRLSRFNTSGAAAGGFAGGSGAPGVSPRMRGRFGRTSTARSDTNNYLGEVSPEQIPASAVLEMLGVRRDTNILDVDTMIQRDTEHLDWTYLKVDAEFRSGNLSREFHRVAAGLHGFLGKSQMVEFVRELQRYHMRRITGGPRDSGGGFSRGDGAAAAVAAGPAAAAAAAGFPGDATRRVARGDAAGPAQQPGASGRKLHISFELFHRAVIRLGLSVSLSHSRVLWAIVSSGLTSHHTFEQMLPAEDVARAVVQLYLQPRNARGERILPAAHEANMPIVTYRGYLTFHTFKRLLRIISCFSSERGARNMWEDMEKDSMEVSDYLPPDLLGQDRRRLFFIRLDIDKLGLDPTRGRVLRIDALQRQLPRLLMSGLSHETVKVLLQLLLQLNINQCRLNEVLDGMNKRTNRYGLIKPEVVGSMLSSLSVEGMSFPMLRDLISKMKLDFPVQDVKRMFDLMDLNNDKSLSLPELLGGFEVLFGKFLPEYICEAVHVTVTNQAYTTFVAVLGLLTFFGFLAVAFSAFTGIRTGMSTVVQSIFALVGAFGLQNQANQDMENVRLSVKTRIEQLFGERITSKASAPAGMGGAGAAPSAAVAAAVEALGAVGSPGASSVMVGRPMKLRYLVPKRYHPELDDPRPCVTFSTNSEVRLEPSISGRCLKESLKWSIVPRLPARIGLKFNEATGVIEGRIPFASGGERDVRMPRRTFVVTCRNLGGAAKAKLTFQVLPRSSRSTFGSANSVDGGGGARSHSEAAQAAGASADEHGRSPGAVTGRDAAYLRKVTSGGGRDRQVASDGGNSSASGGGGGSRRPPLDHRGRADSTAGLSTTLTTSGLALGTGAAGGAGPGLSPGFSEALDAATRHHHGHHHGHQRFDSSARRPSDAGRHRAGHKNSHRRYPQRKKGRSPRQIAPADTSTFYPGPQASSGAFSSAENVANAAAAAGSAPGSRFGGTPMRNLRPQALTASANALWNSGIKHLRPGTSAGTGHKRGGDRSESPVGGRRRRNFGGRRENGNSDDAKEERITAPRALDRGT